MDILLLFLGFIFIFLGIIGSFLPILPGPITGWVGLLLLHLTEAIPQNWTFLGITLGIAILIYILDFIIPALGTKKFGGSKYGMYGTTLGLIVGLLFLGPLGIIIGPFAGALIGELMYDSKDSKRAFRAAYGAFIGFLFSTGLKFIVSLIFTGLFISKFWEYKSGFF
ncbi:MAG: DUF456 domain-containing protein [Flavobacteriaceae bacterium]|nr:DUF456 domain-containing protein [Flavobacteriaceae bacterium]